METSNVDEDLIQIRKPRVNFQRIQKKGKTAISRLRVDVFKHSLRFALVPMNWQNPVFVTRNCEVLSFYPWKGTMTNYWTRKTMPRWVALQHRFLGCNTYPSFKRSARILERRTCWFHFSAETPSATASRFRGVVWFRGVLIWISRHRYSGVMSIFCVKTTQLNCPGLIWSSTAFI